MNAYFNKDFVISQRQFKGSIETFKGTGQLFEQTFPVSRIPF